MNEKWPIHSLLCSEEPSLEKRAEYTVSRDGGFTVRFARYYESLKQQEYESGLFSASELAAAHSKGFLASSVVAYDAGDDGIGDYLSDYHYYKLWPLNNAYRIWINDKLTIRRVLSGIAGVLPAYYYYTHDGDLRYEPDCDQRRYSKDVAGVISLVCDEGSLAMKCVRGAGSESFFKLSADQEGAGVFVNGAHFDAASFANFLQDNKWCIITEYLKPCSQMARIHPLIHTLRLVVLNERGNDPKLVGAYLRFGSSMTGEANYSGVVQDNIPAFDCSVDIETGHFGEGKLVFQDKVAPSLRHPDSACLADGFIPEWNKVVSMVLEVAEFIQPVEWLGFDVGITEKGARIMEINSHCGIKHLQLSYPLMKSPITREYFAKKMNDIAELTDDEKLIRSAIAR